MRQFFNVFQILIPLTFFLSCQNDEEEIILAPELTTDSISAITLTSAICGGTVTSDGGGDIIARGVCWSLQENPTIDDSKTSDGQGSGKFTSNLTGLTSNTTYYVRAYAENDQGISYGDEISFTSYAVMDVDGNGYHAITIGSQVWMTANLKVTRYRNNDPIPNVTDGDEWGSLTSGGYCDYENTESNSAIYGRIYNWYAVDDERGLAPVGWHIASKAEWEELVTFLGGEEIAGGKLKEIGTTHWKSPNTGATNETGFTALPGGGRGFQNTFGNLTIDVSWWTSTQNDSMTAFGRYVVSSTTSCYGYSVGKESGSYVRCIKD